MPLSACFKPLTPWWRVQKEKLLLHPSCPLFLVQALHLYSMCTFQMSCTDQQQVYMGLQSSQQQACAHIQSSSGLHSVSYSSPHQAQTFGLELHKYMSSYSHTLQMVAYCTPGWMGSCTIMHMIYDWIYQRGCLCPQSWPTWCYNPISYSFHYRCFYFIQDSWPIVQLSKIFFFFFYTSYKTFPDPCHLDMCHAHLNMRRTTVQTSK